MQIAGREFSDDIIERIRERVRGDPSVTRTKLSREVCEWMNWRGPDGRLREMSCRVALLKLARCEILELPPARCISFTRQTQVDGLNESWPIVEMTLSELGPVWLVPVDSRQAELSKYWWTMLQTHHPLGAGPLCGAQIRYLVASDLGMLGALSFSAAAWRLAARDKWIGWDDTTRQAELTKVVGNSRFLILPTVKVANLASRVLSLAASRIASDWQKCCGVKPVLLGSVDISHR
ncbi:Druantia anti-phage system protein DruA [Nitrosomonas sp. Nm166]|uniref:Druantia anti-phage system protein DruA n=1 Tax=Nitrosomonas sp. Nm166 TaxID=1881054 RepID=UPI0008ED6600|nr:Druantia anti-phage system protein DruA [Nitrosomonas sp. Nm166]SFE24421.1 protein of unknown function [Nitrosomonas sp. Nm166]